MQERDKNNWQTMKVALITTSSDAAGGAERFYSALSDALQACGPKVDVIDLPAPEPDVETIFANYERFAGLDLSEYDAVISTKAPTYAVSHPNHVVYLVHTVRAFDDMFAEQFPEANRVLKTYRRDFHQRDYEALSGAKKIFSIGHEVSDRLYKWRGLRAEVMHPPLALSGFEDHGIGDYFFMPGRLHDWKRVDLAIQAVRASDKKNLRLVIAGDGEAEAALKALVGDDSRIEFLGRTDDKSLKDYYAGSLAVPFVPVREDYGYVTLEAFASGKPIITCTDSGEPARLVKQRETGLITAPTINALKEAMEWLLENPEMARQMGANGLDQINSMSWEYVANRLLDAVSAKDIQSDDLLKVATLDMQPIDPPVGGGRLRLLGLYHNLGKSIACTYVGSYDWPGETYRCHKLSESLQEITVPLSDEHHDAAAELATKCGDKIVIDLAFSQQGKLSENYLRRVSEAITKADIVVFSHPWVFPLVADQLKPHQLVVYDSHNVEGYLRAQLLDRQHPEESSLLRQVVSDEYDVGSRADLILACSHEDLQRFSRIYEFNPAKMRVLPNGVMASTLTPANEQERYQLRSEMGLSVDNFVAIFIGSPYGPNVDAADFIAHQLAVALPDVTFVIAGGVGETVSSQRDNLICTGPLSETAKKQWLRLSDIAVNPMFAGSGTNIKMFDFMAAGLPVVSTETGARGIEEAGDRCMLRVNESVQDFVSAIKSLEQNKEYSAAISQQARACVEARYSWERISQHLGMIMQPRAYAGRQPVPRFSVIIPTYQRHQQLSALMQALTSQIERDFEVIIVDQSDLPWPEADASFGFPHTYVHTDVKGAVTARNTGADIAQGEILAFTDDDCLPEPDWLWGANEHFEQTAVVGLEGMIISDHYEEEDWRPVTNLGFEGMGFMTANLFMRSAAFQILGGFDLTFDKPHFREDTDMGWRLQELGVVPYAENAVVFHPAQPRTSERESYEARAKFFIKDALLYEKHPEKYRKLFFQERQFEKYPGFMTQLLAGFENNDITVPGWMQEIINQYGDEKLKETVKSLAV